MRDASCHYLMEIPPMNNCIFNWFNRQGLDKVLLL
jgi:hypothetical protein